MILYCAADLLWASKIRGAAEAAGVEARPVRDPGMLRARLADSPVRGLLVDLEAPGAEEIIRTAAGYSAESIRVVAFGPHVDLEKFEAARAAGAARVLPRGAAARDLPHLLRALDQERP